MIIVQSTGVPANLVVFSNLSRTIMTLGIISYFQYWVKFGKTCYKTTKIDMKKSIAILLALGG